MRKIWHLVQVALTAYCQQKKKRQIFTRSFLILVVKLIFFSMKQMLMDEDTALQQRVSRRMSLIIGARRHLEWGHEKYIMDTIQSHPAQVILN